MTALAPPLQQVDRTCVLHRGRKLIYFAGCDYFRLASHPDVLAAVRGGLTRFGLNVSASRKTTGNHVLYEKLESALARFFGVEAAVLTSTGYAANLVAAQALAGEFTHALIDERAHGSLFDAAQFLGCPVTPFPHRNPAAAARAARACGRRAKLLLLTDGLFSHSGQVAPLDEYRRALPREATLLVDDAHGAGVLGARGRGTAEFLGVERRRLIQTVTLSKAFGVYGGAVLGPRALARRVFARSRLFTGNTPLPLPLAAGALQAIALLAADAQPRRRLHWNTGWLKEALRVQGHEVNDGPGPIIPIHPRGPRETTRLRRALLAAGVHPPLINYLGGPDDAYFRIVLSSEHTPAQLAALARALRQAR